MGLCVHVYVLDRVYVFVCQCVCVRVGACGCFRACVLRALVISF